MNIVFHYNSAKTDEEAQALLELLGMPFEKYLGGTWQTSKVKQTRKPGLFNKGLYKMHGGRPHSVLEEGGICRI